MSLARKAHKPSALLKNTIPKTSSLLTQRPSSDNYNPHVVARRNVLSQVQQRNIMSTVAKNWTLKPFFRHPSVWFDKNQDYAYLLHQDFKIKEYMDGLMYRLRIPSSDYTFERYHQAMVVRHHIWLNGTKHKEVNDPMANFLRSREMSQLKQILLKSPKFSKDDKMDRATKAKLFKYLKEYQVEYWDKDDEFRAAAKNLWANAHEQRKLDEMQVTRRDAQRMKNHMMKFFPPPMVDHFLNTMQAVETDEMQQMEELEKERKEYIDQFKNDPLFLKKQYIRDGYQKLLPHLEKLDGELRHRNMILKKMDQMKSPFNYAFVDAVQKSLTDFASTPVYYLPIVHEKSPPMHSARLVAEYVRHTIEAGSRPRDVFNHIKKWQTDEFRRQRVVPFQELSSPIKKKVADRFLDGYKEDQNTDTSPLPFMMIPAVNNDFTKRQFQQFTNTKVFPLAGIRIQISGLMAAAGRKQKMHYDQLVGHDYAGKVNNSAITADVDYHDTFARRNEGSLGIKVWLMFRARVVSQSGVDRTMVA